eukprot:TRINITY_DN3377_c0_g1_i2.p2 TRINITY_DN3377_c0_g1~~TRINITY_DN3377_c0_g1_i2.p2  ORF type:complete len:163 (+),score=63.81 TRINITY_DN3377_c0_g1_i2:160-648(+)
MSKAKAWAEIEDEDTNEARLERNERTEQRTVEGRTFEHKIVQTKYIFPVRRAVKERKKFAKFGEVTEAMVPPKEEKTVRIMTKDDEENAIELVDRLKQLSTEKMKQTKAVQDLENLMQDTTKAEKGGIEFEGVEQYSIRISNFVPDRRFLKGDGNSNFFLID